MAENSKLDIRLRLNKKKLKFISLQISMILTDPVNMPVPMVRLGTTLSMISKQCYNQLRHEGILCLPSHSCLKQFGIISADVKDAVRKFPELFVANVILILRVFLSCSSSKPI